MRDPSPGEARWLPFVCIYLYVASPFLAHPMSQRVLAHMSTKGTRRCPEGRPSRNPAPEIPPGMFNEPNWAFTLTRFQMDCINFFAVSRRVVERTVSDRRGIRLVSSRTNPPPIGEIRRGGFMSPAHRAQQYTEYTNYSLFRTRRRRPPLSCLQPPFLPNESLRNSAPQSSLHERK